MAEKRFCECSTCIGRQIRVERCRCKKCKGCKIHFGPEHITVPYKNGFCEECWDFLHHKKIANTCIVFD